MEIVINQAIFQMTVCFQTCPRNRQPISTETEHLCDLLQEELIVLMPGAQVYERDNVMVSYLDGYKFVIWMSHCLFFPLGLTLFTKDQYTFTLDSYSFSLVPFPQDAPTPVPILLFSF